MLLNLVPLDFPPGSACGPTVHWFPLLLLGLRICEGSALASVPLGSFSSVYRFSNVADFTGLLVLVPVYYRASRDLSFGSEATSVFGGH